MSLLTIETQDHKGVFGDKIDILELDNFTNTEEITAISIAPNASKEYYEKIKTFLQRCNNNIGISNNEVFVGECTKEEFYKGEEIINSIIEKINPDWTDLQKSAFVHYEMGKIISYYPDFNFLSKNIHTSDGNKLMNNVNNDCRNIWKELCTKKGVCNGIVDINRTILSRMGIKTKTLTSRTHTFLLTKTEEGDIITDPTWDLEYALYDLRPAYFGLSYEEFQQRDGDSSRAHRLDNPPENIRVISDKELRKVYSSIEKADKDGMFGRKVIDEVDRINKMHFNDDYEKYCYVLEQFADKFSEKMNNLSENRTILQIILYNMGIDIEKLETSFIYDKSDKVCENPILSLIYEDSNGKGHATILNQEEKKFKPMKLTEFDEKYNLHVCNEKTAGWKKYIDKTKEKMDKQTEMKERES